MPREFSRGRKIADLIQRELALLIQREVKDPRIGMVTINEATVSRDLAYSDVYFTVLPSDDTEQVEKVLNQASGFLRSQLAKILNTRTTPKLPKPPTWARQRGLALIVVLWAAILLALLAGGVARLSRSDLNLARNLVESTKAELAADSALWTAVHMIVNGGPDAWRSATSPLASAGSSMLL